MAEGHFSCVIDQSKYNARSDSSRGEINSTPWGRKDKVTLQRRLHIRARGFCGHDLKSVLCSLLFIFFLCQNILIPSQDSKCLIQLCHQAPNPVLCDLHLVQIKMRLLRYNFYQSPSLHLKRKPTAPHLPNMQWWDRGRATAVDASVQRREE